MTMLVVAAHPDDEALGCGGTMLRYAGAGGRVHVLLLADGEGARGSAALARVGDRRNEAAAACKLLGALPPRFEKFPDNRMDDVPLIEVVWAVERVVHEVRPEFVYTHHAGDLNVDHRVVQQAVMTACRPQPGSSVRGIYAFEVPSSTDWAGTVQSSFIPSRYVDISAQLQGKIRALACYKEEMREYPHCRSYEAVEALAKWRGASIGLAAAEAFVVMREIVAGPK